MTHNIIYVGIDVGKFEFCVFCEGADSVFSLPNDVAGHRKLIKYLGSPDGKIIALEPTGGCEWVL
jgi:hypothetical protein